LKVDHIKDQDELNISAAKAIKASKAKKEIKE